MTSGPRVRPSSPPTIQIAHAPAQAFAREATGDHRRDGVQDG